MPTARRSSPRTAELPSTAETVTKAKHHQREIFGRPELESEVHHRLGQEREPDGADGAGHERADGGGGEAAPARPRRAILFPSMRGDDGGALARRVHQDRGGGSAVHGAVVDAGEQDEGGGGIDLVGERQQQGDGERRPQPRQHADGGADRDADQAPHQIVGRQRHGKAGRELRPASPSQEPLDRGRSRSGSPARGRSRCRRSSASAKPIAASRKLRRLPNASAVQCEQQLSRR